jgi:hypothetical protein
VAIAYAQKNGKIKVDGYFLLSPSMKKIPLRIHKNGDAERNIEEIYPKEIDAGLIECIKNSLSISSDDLIVETAKLFGLRATKNVLDNIQSRITSLLQSQEIKIQADKIVLSNS